MGGGAVAGGRGTEKNSRKRKLSENKIHARQLILKDIHALAEKKIHTRNLIMKKNSCGSKIPLPPPITFLMVRSLGKLETEGLAIFLVYRSCDP